MNARDPHFASRDPLGARRLYLRDGRVAGSVRALLDGPVALDPAGVAFAWGEGGDGRRSCFAGVARVPPGYRVVDGVIAPAPLIHNGAGGLGERLLGATARLVDGRVALWLSGGLDSALLLALTVELGASLPVYVLRPRLGDDAYDEHAAALALARRFGVEPVVVDAGEDDFVAALPDAIGSIEQPLYNLHPVGKLLLARRLAADGFCAALTGDGADQLFAHDAGDDYLPLVGALLDGAGVALRSPFLDDELVAWARTHGPDPDKSALRALAQGRLPDELAHAPKRARLAPPLDLRRHLRPARIERVARALGRPLSSRSDREWVQWITLSLLCDQLPVEL